MLLLQSSAKSKHCRFTKGNKLWVHAVTAQTITKDQWVPLCVRSKTLELFIHLPEFFWLQSTEISKKKTGSWISRSSLRLTLSSIRVGGASEESTGHVRACDVHDRGPLLNSTDYFRMTALCQQRQLLTGSLLSRSACMCPVQWGALRQNESPYWYFSCSFCFTCLVC